MTVVRAGAPWLSRYTRLLAASTFLLVIAGGLVTSTGSGLAVPDWPLSFGQVFPRMEGGVLFEHGHRMIATFIGLMTIGLVVLVHRLESRPWVKTLAWLALVLVVVQGVLGGATVLLRLPDAVSVSHAGTAQLFFALTVVMAAVTSPAFIAEAPAVSDRGAATRMLALATVIAIYVQILLGAVVRHTGAGLAITDYPLSFGRLVPPLGSSLVAWHFLHRWFALLPAALIAWTVVRVVRFHGSPWLVRPAAALCTLAAWQIFLGAFTVWTRKAVVPTTAHVAVGALVFVTAVLLVVRLYRKTERGREGETERWKVAAGQPA